MAKTEIMYAYLLCERCNAPIVLYDPRKPIDTQNAVDEHLKLPDHYAFDISVVPNMAPLRLQTHGGKVTVIFMVQGI